MGIDPLTGPGRRAVFLDRDGVINRAIVHGGKPYPPSSVEDLVILDGVDEALRKLHDAGYLLIVVTNQPDVARGTQSVATVEAMHQFLQERLVLDEIVACYHDGETCSCRKPRPGALLDAARRHHIDLGASFMVGDRWRDVEAAQRAGCAALFIDRGYEERQPEPPFVRVGSLAEAAEWILAR